VSINCVLIQLLTLKERFIIKDNQILMNMNKNYSFIALIVSFIVLVLFLSLGLILTVFFLQNLLTGISGFGLTQILFLLIGIYLVYKSGVHIKFLIKNRNKFNEILEDFIEENKKALIITVILSVVLLILLYSNISTNFDFFVNAVLYLPMFLLNNLVFIANIFLLRYDMLFLTFFIALILPISEVIFLFWISGLIAKFLKHKR
jgi:hypothetical protein